MGLYSVAFRAVWWKQMKNSMCYYILPSKILVDPRKFNSKSCNFQCIWAYMSNLILRDHCYTFTQNQRSSCSPSQHIAYTMHHPSGFYCCPSKLCKHTTEMIDWLLSNREECPQGKHFQTPPVLRTCFTNICILKTEIWDWIITSHVML